MMTGLTRRRRTAQQILLRRACLSKSVSRSQDVAQIPAGMDRDRGGIVVLPSLARDLELSRERKWQRDLAASTYRVSGDRKSAGKLPGCEPLRKDSRSWRKLKLSEDNTNRSGHSLKPNERSGGSARSRNSSSPYPSSWPLAEKAEAKGVDSLGSLDEIIHCSCLSRTPYDHKLSTPLKSDNSCQCTFVKRARRRNRKIKAVSVAQTQTQSIQESRSRSQVEGRTNRRKRTSKDRLRNRVYSGEDVCPDRKSSKSNSDNSKPSSTCKVNNPGVKFKNYGGYSPSETDIETASDYKPNTPSRCSDSFYNKIEKVSRPPSLNGNKWSLKMPSNTEMQEYFDAADQENTCLNICLSNYNSSECQARRSKTSRTSNDQFSGKGCSNTMRIGSDRTSRMSDSFHGSHGCKYSSKANSQGYPREEDRVEEFGSCRRNRDESISPSRNREQVYPTEVDRLEDFGSCRINREAGISSRTREASMSSRNSDQFLSNYEDENDINDKSTCIYQSNTIKNGSDPARILQTKSNEYSAGADPSYERLLPRNENYPNQRLPDEVCCGSSHPNQQLQHGRCGADMNQNQRSQEGHPNAYKSSLGIAGTHRDPTNYPHRSRASGPADRMGGSRGCCGTGNWTRGNTRGPSDVENEWQPSDAIAYRKCTEAVTQTSEFLMAPRTELSGGSCLHKTDQGLQETNRFSQMQPKDISRMPQANEVKFNEGNSSGMNMNSQFKSFGENASNQVQSRSEHQSKPKPLHLVQTNSYVLQSDQMQYKLVKINSLELNENRSNEKAEDTSYGSTFPRPPCNQEKANGIPEKSQKSSRNRNRNRSRNRRRNRTACNTSQGNQSYDTCNGQRSDSSDQREDKCDVIKILDILQKTVAGLEKEINKAKGYESGRSNRICCDPKMNKHTVANVDSRENCGQNRNSAPEPRLRPPYPTEFPDSYQQHNFPMPYFNNGMDPEIPQSEYQTNNPYTNGNCGHNNGINPNNLQSPTDSYQDRNAPPSVYKCCNENSPGSVEIPYRSAPDPGQAGDYATTEQNYPRDVHKGNRYTEQTNLVYFQNNRMANDPQEHNSFPNTKWYGNNPQSNVCSGMTEPRYGNYLNDTKQFGNQAPQAAECAPCHKADKPLPINRGGVTFQEYNDYSNEKLGGIYKETEDYPRLNKAETFHCQSMYKADEAPPINRGGVTFPEHNDYSNKRLERNYKETGEYPLLNRAESIQSENGFKCCNPEPLFGEREAYPFIRSAKPLGECPHNADSSRSGMYSKDPANRCTKSLFNGTQNTERSRKRTCSKDSGAQKYKQTHQRRRSSSPKRIASSKRQGSPKANKINKNRIQPKKADKVTRTKKESDTEGCGNPARVNTASNKAQHPVKVNQVSNKNNVSKKQVPDIIRRNNTEQTAYKVFDCAFCENPNCPNKKTIEKRNLPLQNNRTPTDHNQTKQRRVELCKCPDRKRNHWEGHLLQKDRKTTDKEFNNKKMLCENPQCPDKLSKNIEHRYEKVSRFELCENPNCPDRKTNKSNQDQDQEYCPGRTRVLFDVDNNISRQSSGKSGRFDNDPIETRICRQIRYHRHVEKSRLGRAVNCRPYEIENRRKPKVGECNLCLRPEMPPPICVRSRHNPYIKTVSPLNSYDRHILKNFEYRKSEKSIAQKCAKVSPLKNQTPSTDYSCSSPEETVEEETSEGDVGKSLCSCQAEESYKHEEGNSKSKSSIFSCCMKPPREKPDRKQKVTRPQKETKIKENPESKQKEKSPSKSSGLFSCKSRERTQSKRERPQSKRENPKKVQEKRKQSEKTPSKSSGLLCFKKEEKRPPQEKETNYSNTSIKSQKPKRETEEKPSWFKGLQCRERSPREKKEKEIPLKEEKVRKPRSETEEKPSWLTGFQCRERSPREKKEKEIPLKEEKVKKPRSETEEKPSWFTGFQCRERSPREKTEKEEKVKKEKAIPHREEKLEKEKEIPQRKDKIRKEEKTKKPSKCVEFITCSRKPKTQKERDDELRPPLRIVCTNRQKEQVRPVDKCPCAEDQPREDHASCKFNSGAPPFTSPCDQEEQGDQEVKVLYDSSFRFSPESCSCAEVPKIVYCHSNPQNPGQQESASLSTFSRQEFEDPEDAYRPCASSNGFYKIVQ